MHIYITLVLFGFFVSFPQGRLAGVGGEDLPTIVIVAHYDSFGVAPVSLHKPLNVFIFLTQNNQAADE